MIVFGIFYTNDFKFRIIGYSAIFLTGNYSFMK